MFVFGRRCWGWSETCYLTHEKAVARGVWQSSQNFGFTAVSVTHRAACLCAAIQWLCCCVRRKETMSAGLTVDQQNRAGGSWSLDSVAHWWIMVYVAAGGVWLFGSSFGSHLRFGTLSGAAWQNPLRQGGKSGVTFLAAHCVLTHWVSFIHFCSCCCLRTNHISSTWLYYLSQRRNW